MHRSMWCFFAAMAVVVSCDGATEPTPAAVIPAQVGTYDFTANLMTFRFETSYQECPPYVGQLYCFFSKPANGATLSGTLVIGPKYTDSVAAYGHWFTDVKASVTGQFCSAWTAASGCTALKEVVADYGPGSLLMNYYSMGPYVDIRGAGQITLTAFTLVGDSAFAGVYWSLSPPGRYPPSYTGTFVARKRH